MKRILSFLVLLLSSATLIACTQADENTFVVGLECDYAPFNWTTSDASGVSIFGIGGYCDGYDVDMAILMAEALGRDLVIRKIDWDGLIPALNAGTIDAIIAGMSPTPVRAEVVAFSDPYFRSEQVLIVRGDSNFAGATSLADLNTARVIAQLNTLQDELIEQIPGATRMNPLGDYAGLVASVQSGTADALIAELPVATAIAAANTDLVVVRLTEGGFVLDETQVTVSVAVRQDDTTTLAVINQVLSDLSDEARNELMTEALNRQP